MATPTTRVTPSPGEESVWDYARPPRLEPLTRRLQAMFQGLMVAGIRRGCRVQETYLVAAQRS